MAIAAPPLKQSFMTDSAGKKKNHYVSDGTVIGGNQLVRTFRITDLRRSPIGKDGYERVVFELDSGEATKEPPHYEMVAVPEKKKVIVSLWGSATYDFKKEKAETLFKKSSLIKKLTPVQIVDDGLAILEFTTANKPKVEIFHLSNPARIVLDFKP